MAAMGQSKMENDKLAIKTVKTKFQNLKDEFLEMAQLKSQFDIEKFTVRREGSFIAHNFHFLMRQYSLALYELRRILIDFEERTRDIQEYTRLLVNGENKVEVMTDRGIEKKYIDLEIERLKNSNDLQELTLKSKYEACLHFEKCRLKLIELNDGAPPTNEQYQKEEPAYWKWFLNRAAITQKRARETGIDQGVWLNIDNLEQPPLLNPDFQVMMLDSKGILNMGEANQENEICKGLLARADNILKINNELQIEN